MNMLKRLTTVVMDMVFVFLAMNALIIVFGFFANLVATGGHGHWATAGLALAMAVALKIFIWLLPLTALIFLIGSLIGSEVPSASQK
jgi:hypothetical protein